MPRFGLKWYYTSLEMSRYPFSGVFFRLQLSLRLGTKWLSRYKIHGTNSLGRKARTDFSTSLHLLAWPDRDQFLSWLWLRLAPDSHTLQSHTRLPRRDFHATPRSPLRGSVLSRQYGCEPPLDEALQVAGVCCRMSGHSPTQVVIWESGRLQWPTMTYNDLQWKFM